MARRALDSVANDALDPNTEQLQDNSAATSAGIVEKQPPSQNTRDAKTNTPRGGAGLVSFPHARTSKESNLACYLNKCWLTRHVSQTLDDLRREIQLDHRRHYTETTPRPLSHAEVIAMARLSKLVYSTGTYAIPAVAAYCR